MQPAEDLHHVLVQGVRGADVELEAAVGRCDLFRHATLDVLPAATAIVRERLGAREVWGV